MAFCTKCGNQLPEGSKFCPKCGTPAVTPTAVNHPAPQKTWQQPVQQTPKQYIPQQSSQPKAASTQKSQPVKQQSKKKKGGGKKFLAFVLIVAILFTGFVEPGFIKKLFEKENPPVNVIPTQPGGNTVNPVSTEPKDEGWDGNSKALDYSPYDGFHITADKNAFEQNTTIKVEPVTSETKLPEATWTAFTAIQEDGVLPIAAFEVDAGLADDEIIPGVYTVEIDLEKLDIPEIMHDNLAVYRVGDDGSYYEYAAQVKDGKLVYSTTQNSLLLIGARIVVYGALIYFAYPTAKEIVTNFYESEYAAPTKYFYDAKKKEFSLQHDCGYATYKLHWAMEDIGYDYADKVKQLEDLVQTYRAKGEKLYKDYLEGLDLSQNSFETTLQQHKSIAEVLIEEIEKDPTYIKLNKEMTCPPVIQDAINYIDKAWKYLKEQEFMKMPTGVVEITSSSSDGALALTTNRMLHTAWVAINLGKLKDATKATKDEFLVTATHELLHVCQQEYRYPWADSNKFDEMVAIVVERRAMGWFEYSGDIDGGPGMDVNPTDYWSTLKLPIDKYWAGPKGDDGSVMQHEGYNLGLFVEYLAQKVITPIWGNKLQQNKCEWINNGISKPLCDTFGIDVQELETHWKTWTRQNKSQFATQYNLGERDYNPNQEVTIIKGGKYHVDVVLEGGYAASIRSFKQATTDPMNLILVPDSTFASAYSMMHLVPIEKFTTFSKGAYIPAISERNLAECKRNRNILEIVGYVPTEMSPEDEDIFLAVKQGEALSGYTVYVFNNTGIVSASDDEVYLKLKMPESSALVDDKIVDGYLLTIVTPEGNKIEKELDLSYANGSVEYDKAKLLGKEYDPTEPMLLEITLCEFIKNGTDKIFGEPSETVYYTINEEADLKADLNAFTGAWIPIEFQTKQMKEGDWIIALIYLPEDNEFGEFEGPANYINNSKRWVEIMYFDYDPNTRTLTIDFDKNCPDKATGTATYRLDNNDHLWMTNSSGSWEFFRSPEE